MAAVETARFSIFSLLYFASLQIILAQKYVVPDVKIQAFKPKGFKASIPDSQNIGLFVFQGNVNNAIGNTDVGTLSGEILKATDGRWVFEDPNVQLKVGDVINYYVFVSRDQVGYLKDNQSYRITDLEDPSSQPPTNTESPVTSPRNPADCKPTQTVVRNGRACSGETIFEDDFSSLREDIWQIEQYIPINHPEYPFISYQRLSTEPTVSVKNGQLNIEPRLQQNLPGYDTQTVAHGYLNLFNGCTRSADACYKQAVGANILPPVVSGRITSKGFAFTYGTVHVRAKLPQGDWIYPEILLEPFLKKYGTLNYASGVMKIATARGNRVLRIGSTDYSNSILYGGPIMDLNCRATLLTNKAMNVSLNTISMWGDDFHDYSLRWAPDRITLSVDGEEWARVEPAASGLRGRLAHCRDAPHLLWATGTRMAPFDDHFYLTLGVAVGGVTEFPDGVYTRTGRPKPWRNQESKALLKFWQDLDWLQTWDYPKLLIDYIKVVAL